MERKINTLAGVHKRMNRNRLLGTSNNNKATTVVMAIASLSIMVTAVLSPYSQIQVAAQQQQNNVNNTPKLSLPTVSTAVGTGAAGTVAIVAVPGILRSRKQSKCLTTYLLKIHEKYAEFCKKQDLQKARNI